MDGRFIALPQVPGFSDFSPVSPSTEGAGSRGPAPPCAYSFSDNVSFDVQYNPGFTPLVHLPYLLKSEATESTGISADGSVLMYHSKPSRPYPAAATQSVGDGTWSSEYNYNSQSCYSLPALAGLRIDTDVYPLSPSKYSGAVATIGDRSFTTTSPHQYPSPPSVDLMGSPAASDYSGRFAYAEPAQRTHVVDAPLYPSWETTQSVMASYSQNVPQFPFGGSSEISGRHAFAHGQHVSSGYA